MRLSLNFEHDTLQCEARVVQVEPCSGQCPSKSSILSAI